MVSPTITELSGVDHPAHLTEGWLMMKDASPETALMLARAEAIAKGIDPTSVTSAIQLDPKGSATMTAPITDEVRASLDPAVQTYLKSLEDANAESVAKALSLVDSDTDAAIFEKAIAGLPDAARTIMIKQQRDLAEQTAITKALRDEREDSRFEAMAKELVHLPGVDTESGNNEFASIMRKASDSNPTAFAGIFKVLKSADAVVKESGIFSELGSALSGEVNALGSVEAIAKSLRAADPTLSEAEAMTKAVSDNPELYAQHRKEA